MEKVLRALEERLRESDGRGEAMEEVIRGVLDYVKDSNLLERGGLAQGEIRRSLRPCSES